MDNVNSRISREDLSNLYIDNVFEDIEKCLKMENEYLNNYLKQSKIKLYLEDIFGLSKYTPGKYVKEARELMDKLMHEWINLLTYVLRYNKSLDLQIPPITGYSSNMEFVVIDQNYLYKATEESEILGKEIQFKLINDNTIYTNKLDIEVLEYRKPIYLDNNEKYNYLCDCINYINEINSKEIFKYGDIIKLISAFFTTNGRSVMGILEQANLRTLEIIRSYANVLFLATEYMDRKVKIIEKELQIIRLGIEGEKLINNHLQMYEDEIINLSNIRLEVDGESIENDNILLTPYGIYILEVKNLGSKGSYSLNISKDGKWYKKFTNGTTEGIEYDASMQNERHIRYLQKHINKKLNRNIDDSDYVKVNGLVIIANNKIDIENNSELPIFRVSEIYRQIVEKEVIFTKKELLNLKEVILSENLKPKKYETYDYLGELKDNFSVLNQQLDFYDLSEYGLKLILICFEKLNEIIHKIKLFESEYNCRLKGKDDFWGNINEELVENIMRYIIKLDK